MSTVLLQDVLEIKPVASGTNGSTHKGRKKVERASRFSLTKALGSATVLDTEEDTNGTPHLIGKAPREAKAPKFMVVARVVKNPGAKKVETREVHLYSDGKGGLALKGECFTNESLANAAIRTMKTRETILMYKAKTAYKVIS